jgi:hypothetical protein
MIGDTARVLSAVVSASTRPEIVRPSTRVESETDISLSFAILEGEDAFEITAIVNSDQSSVDAEFTGAVEGTGQVGIADALTGTQVIVLLFGVLFVLLATTSIGLDFLRNKNKWKDLLAFGTVMVAISGFILALLVVGFLLNRVWEHFIPESAAPPEMQELVRPSSD